MNIAIGIVAGLAGLLVVAEILLRAMSSRLRPLTKWKSWEIHNKFVAAQNLAKQGGASVVAIGTSAVNASIDPQLLSTLGARERPAFNAALNGSSPQMLELWTLRILIPLLKPDVIVYGLDSSQVNAGNILAARNFDRLRTSQGWGEWTHTGGLVKRTGWWLRNHMFVARYGRHIFSPKLFRQDRLQRSTSCRRLGLLRWVMVFRYRPYSIKTRQMKAWSDALNEYEIGSEWVGAMGRLIDGIKAAGVLPIIMPVPYTDDWIPFHPHGKADVDAWMQVIQSTSAEHGAAFVDLGDRFPGTDLFADPVHLNGAGQIRFTELVAGVIADAATSPSR